MNRYNLVGDAAGPCAALHLALTKTFGRNTFVPDQIAAGAAPVLITVIEDPERVMAEARDFAATPQPDNPDRSVVVILPPPTCADWSGIRAGAMLWAFTRISALSWAPRRIRINLISLGADPTQPWSRPRGDRPLVPAQDVIAAIEALSRWPCVTGQCICLGA